MSTPDIPKKVTPADWPIRNVVDTGDGNFDCEVEHPDYGWIPYTARSDDPISGAAVHKNISALPSSQIGTKPQPTVAQLSAKARSERDTRLTAMENQISVVRWFSLTQAQQQALLQYRQDLLNVPQQAGFPKTITWPTLPNVNSTPDNQSSSSTT